MPFDIPQHFVCGTTGLFRPEERRVGPVTERAQREALEASARDRQLVELQRLIQPVIQQQMERVRQVFGHAAQQLREQQRLETPRQERARIEQQMLAQQRADREGEAYERVRQQQLEQQRLEVAQQERERREAQRLEQQRLERIQLEREQREEQRLAQQRLERAQQERERREQHQLELQRQERVQREHEQREPQQLEQQRSDSMGQANENRGNQQQELQRLATQAQNKLPISNLGIGLACLVAALALCNESVGESYKFRLFSVLIIAFGTFVLGNRAANSMQRSNETFGRFFNNRDSGLRESARNTALLLYGGPGSGPVRVEYTTPSDAPLYATIERGAVGPVCAESNIRLI